VEQAPAVDALCAGTDPAVRRTYARILEALRVLGEVREEPKKTSIHLIRSSGFAGVHPRKSALVLNIRLDRALDGGRLLKTERVSKNRYHNEFRLAGPEDVDDRLAGWLREAYELAG
jgi:hypothetical protein